MHARWTRGINHTAAATAAKGVPNGGRGGDGDETEDMREEEKKALIYHAPLSRSL